VEVLQPALKQAPDDVALMALAGEVYMQNNEFAKAVPYFEKAAKLDPKSAGVRTELGLSRLAAGENERALADLESAGQLDSGKFQADILLVMSHLQRANYDQALKALQGLEKKQPDNPLTYNLKAAIYIGKNDIPSARKALERALELQPAYVPAAMNLAQLDLQDKNPQAARQRLEGLLAKAGDNVQALLALANLALRIGATAKEQIEWLERARKAAPDAVEPQVMLAQAYARSGDPKKALDVAQQAAAAAPANPEVLAMLGGIQLGAGDKAQALATYGKLVTLQPKSPIALYRLAAAEAANADQKKAVDTLKKALSLKPDYVDAQAALVGLETRAGHYAEAMQVAQQVQKQAAKSPAGYVLEGDVLMAEKKFAPAAKAYDTAYSLAKSGPLAIKLHAATAQAGKPDEADARLAQWLKESPEDVNARAYAGESAIRRGKYKEAIVHYEWLQQKQPDNLLVLNNLAWAYQQAKDPRALETAEKAYKLKPDNAAVVDTLGWMLVERGDATRGVELLQKAVSAAPNAQEIRYHLAQAWVKAGDKAKARNELERLLSTDAKFPQQDEALALLKQLRN
jgi:putative PEP-CTERM system TPR-repeat lipoprotein